MIALDQGDAPGPIWAPIGRLLEPAYRFAINRRNRAFDAGKGVVTLDRPVISVGNLSVGGTGKTPMVQRLVEELRASGRSPCVAMRGYKAAPGEAADEEAAYRRLFPGVPVVAQPDRVAGLRALFETDAGRAVDCVVLDDGFQHRRIARALDIVLLDASRGALDGRLLPAGWLREPVGSLARAHAVVLTHAEMVEDGALRALTECVRAASPRALIATTRHAWAGLDVEDDDGSHERPVEERSGRRVFVVCAIGHPHALAAGVSRAGGELTGMIRLPDHDDYTPKTVERIARAVGGSRAELLLTTDKDWSKLQRVPRDRWPCPVVRPRLELGFDGAEGGALFALATVAAGSTAGAGA